MVKFGGTSVQSIESRDHCIQRVRQHLAQNRDVVVVVSARAGFTNELVSRVEESRQAGIEMTTEEIARVVTIGENESVSLFGAQLRNRVGRDTRGLLGFQVPIMIRDGDIDSIGTQNLARLVQSGVIPVVAGFQGINSAGQIASLDRGGSDITAAATALALCEAGLSQRECFIYTDVPCMYAIDPRLGTMHNRILDRISYRDAYILALNGAKVIHHDSVRIAERLGIELRILSYNGTADPNSSGTVICDTAPPQDGIAFTRDGEMLNIFVLHNGLPRFRSMWRTMWTKGIINRIAFRCDSYTIRIHQSDLTIVRYIIDDTFLGSQLSWLN